MTPDSDDGAAASFETIAAELGISRQRVRGIYEIALRKIRNNPEILRQLEGHR